MTWVAVLSSASTTFPDRFSTLMMTWLSKCLPPLAKIE
jgi:hypothetical protein